MNIEFFQKSEVEQLVSALRNSEHRDGDELFWMGRGAKLATALILAVCNSKGAEIAKPDILSFKVLSDILTSKLAYFRQEDLSVLKKEAGEIFYWIDEIYAGTTSEIHVAQAEYVLQLYRNALPKNGLIARIIRDLRHP